MIAQKQSNDAIMSLNGESVDDGTKQLFVDCIDDCSSLDSDGVFFLFFSFLFFSFSFFLSGRWWEEKKMSLMLKFLTFQDVNVIDYSMSSLNRFSSRFVPVVSPVSNILFFSILSKGITKDEIKNVSLIITH